MKKQENHQDDLLKNLFQEVEVKKGLDITEKVMARIQQIPETKPITYKPPISKKGWILVGSIFFILIAFAFAMESSAYFELSTLSSSFRSVLDQLGNSFTISIPTIQLPEFSFPYLMALLAFNIAGIFFVFSYWRLRRI